MRKTSEEVHPGHRGAIEPMIATALKDNVFRTVHEIDTTIKLKPGPFMRLVEPLVIEKILTDMVSVWSMESIELSRRNQIPEEELSEWLKEDWERIAWRKVKWYRKKEK